MEMIKQPETEEFEKNGVRIVELAKMLVIGDHMDYENAGAFLNQVTTNLRNIEENFEDPVQKAHQAHKSMVALRDKVLSPFKTAKMLIAGKMGDWQINQDRLRREAAVKASQEAQVRAENERLAQAQAAEARGDKEAVESLLNAPLTPRIDPAAIPDAAPKVKGVTTRKDWDFQITDPARLPREYLIPDEVKIRKTVRALGAECAIPGVAVFEKTVVGSRGV